MTVSEFLLTRELTTEDIDTIKTLGIDFTVYAPKNRINDFAGRPQFYYGRREIRLVASTDEQRLWLALKYSHTELILISETIHGPIS